jgi:uncharacterized protein YndB with AHSA1/START domain
MTAPANPPADPAADRAVVNTRVFDVPRAVLFRAFSDPARLAAWWGPQGFTNTFTKFEFRPGGDWHQAMRGPDGSVYENVSRFVTIDAPERIVFEHLGPMHWYRMTITLAECPGGTRLTWHMAFASAEECAKVRDFVLPANEENFDRLAAHLAGRNPT